jgi:hypothetical protein
MSVPFRPALAALLLTAAVLAAAGPVQAAESHVYVQNKSDAWVWVTAYTGTAAARKNAGAWCVIPGILDRHGLRADVSEVRAEVTQSGCKHPVMLDQRRSFPSGAGPSNTMTYYIRGAKGAYVFDVSP